MSSEPPASEFDPIEKTKGASREPAGSDGESSRAACFETSGAEPSPEAALPNSVGPLRESLAPAVRIASGLTRKAGFLALATGLSGLFLWLLIVAPFDGLTSALRIAAALALLGLLGFPALFLGLFWLGLRSLLHVPDRLLTSAEEGMRYTGTLASSALDSQSYSGSGLVHFVRSVTRLRDSLLESRMLLIQIAATARLVNPFFIGGLLIAFSGGLILILAAGIAGILILAF